MSLSVIIITLNESKNLPKCLASIPKEHEVVIVDSGSTDDTVKIATDWGATVFEKKFIDYASQKNFALAKATGEWVLSVDADEVLEDNFFEKVHVVTKGSTEKNVAFRVKRNLVFMNRLLRFGKTQDFPIRLFPNDRTIFEGSVHEKVNTDQLQVEVLKNTGMLHYSYANLTDYFTRFNRYTTMIAENGKNTRSIKFRLNLYFRFWVEFLVRYIFRGGFLDGHPGYCYALISSLYSYIKFAKQIEK